ncbi:MAG TPA: lipoprotein [Dokdonella sp.]
MSSSRSILRPSALALTVLLLAACGNKGDLVKPTPKPAPAPPPATPATSATPAADAAQH